MCNQDHPKSGTREVKKCLRCPFSWVYLHRDRLFNIDFSGQIAVGDLLWLEQVGAYSIVMKPPFILPNVAIIEFDRRTDNTRIIKRAETFDDVFSTYNIGA